MSEIAAIILAAGRGSRYGAEGNKLLIDLGGQPIVRRVARTALASRLRRVVVVTGHARHEIETALAGLPVSFAHNAEFGSGLASSLRAGLAAIEGADGAVVLLGDMPRISATVVDSLIAAFAKAPDCASVVPTCGGRRGNPVLIGRAIFPQVMQLRGDEGARKLLRAAERVVELPLDDMSILADIDTPDDLIRLKRS